MTYTPHTEEDRRLMLERIGVASIGDLFSDIPEEVRLARGLDLPPGLSEEELVKEVMGLASKNKGSSEYVCFAGAGAYDHFIPSAIRHLIERSEFYTAYTPYQAEISQGLLEAIFEYQSMMSRLLDMEVSNASLYDGATAVAEAAMMAARVTGRPGVVVSLALHPEYRETLATYAENYGLHLREVEAPSGVTDLEGFRRALDEEACCGILQNPNFFGCLERMADFSIECHRHKTLFIACVDPVSLGVLAPPGEYEADIAVGEGQGLGIPLSFGGPYLGVFACREELVRFMPGRVVGATEDRAGRRGYVLTLQAREQHVRRARATSNICSNHALSALAAAIYLALLGRSGIREVAEHCLYKSHYLSERLTGVGFRMTFEAPFFKEFTVESPIPPERLLRGLLDAGFLGGVALGRFGAALGRLSSTLEHAILIAVTEKRTRREIDDFVSAAGGLVCRRD